MRNIYSALEAYQIEEREKLSKVKIDRVDFRKITRRSKTCVTTVTIHLDWNTRVEWLTFGEANIQKFENQSRYLLKSYLLEGTTDFEHDSAYVLRLPLIGLEFGDLYYHRTSFSAIIDPNNPEDFRVPGSGYDPFKMKEIVRCKDGSCAKHPHWIVPEGYYAGAPFDRELFEVVRGKKVEITVSPVVKPRER
jgi:hypothetical protein